MVETGIRFADTAVTGGKPIQFVGANYVDFEWFEIKNHLCTGATYEGTITIGSGMKILPLNIIRYCKIYNWHLRQP
jgi:hypothetical protein